MRRDPARDDRTGETHRDVAGRDAARAEPRDAFLDEVELEQIVAARLRCGYRRVHLHRLAREQIAGELRARAVPNDARTGRGGPVVAEADRERPRPRERGATEVLDRHL